MKNLTNYIFLAVLVAAFICGYWYNSKELKRIESNYLAAVQSMQKSNAEQQRIYTLSIDELKSDFPTIKQQLKDMNIKLKNVRSIENINTETKTIINTVLKDSVVNDTVKLQYAEYTDNWTTFKLIKVEDSIHSTITTKDSLFCVINSQKRSLKQWLKGEPRIYVNTIKNHNPNSKITYNRFIQVEK